MASASEEIQDQMWLGDYCEAERVLWLLAIGAALASADARALLKGMPEKSCILVEGNRVVESLNSGNGKFVWKMLKEVFLIPQGKSSTAVEAIFTRLKDRVACRTLRVVALNIAAAVEQNDEEKAISEARRLASFIQGT